MIELIAIKKCNSFHGFMMLVSFCAVGVFFFQFYNMNVMNLYQKSIVH